MRRRDRVVVLIVGFSLIWATNEFSRFRYQHHAVFSVVGRVKDIAVSDSAHNVYFSFSSAYLSDLCGSLWANKDLFVEGSPRSNRSLASGQRLENEFGITPIYDALCRSQRANIEGGRIPSVLIAIRNLSYFIGNNWFGEVHESGIDIATQLHSHGVFKVFLVFIRDVGTPAQGFGLFVVEFNKLVGLISGRFHFSQLATNRFPLPITDNKKPGREKCDSPISSLGLQKEFLNPFNPARILFLIGAGLIFLGCICIQLLAPFFLRYKEFPRAILALILGAGFVGLGFLAFHLVVRL